MNKDKTKQFQWKYFELLNDMGLGADEAKIYEYLLDHKDSKARTIALDIGMSRVLVYRALDKLIQKAVIEKTEEEGAVAIFNANHPSHLTRLLEKQKQIISKAELELERDLGSMASLFNLTSGKPNVQFFEGIEGVQKIVWDTLTSTTDIYAYFDTQAVDKYYKDLDKIYRAKRLEKKINKKMLFPNTEYAIQSAHELKNNLSDIRLLEKNFEFSTVMQIYDNKVSYLTLEKDRQIGIIIEDVAIYKTHEALFEAHWEQAKNI